MKKSRILLALIIIVLTLLNIFNIANLQDLINILIALSFLVSEKTKDLIFGNIQATIGTRPKDR